MCKKDESWKYCGCEEHGFSNICGIHDVIYHFKHPTLTLKGTVFRYFFYKTAPPGPLTDVLGPLFFAEL